jgi:hypothetical protein
VNIAIVVEAKTPLGVDVHALADNLYWQVRNDFAPARGRSVGKIIVAGSVPAGWWGLIFLDDSDQADALGYHDLTDAGLPQGKVFVRTAVQAGVEPSVTASHELLEMLADPSCALLALAPDNDPRGIAYALEVCDPVEDSTYMKGHVKVSNFVYPAYFEASRAPGSARFDHLGTLNAPFSVTSGGYVSTLGKDGTWKSADADDVPGGRPGRRS